MTLSKGSMMTEEISKKISEILLGINAIKLSPQNPFTWASGWKSPIYCDNRKSLSFPEARTVIKNSLGKMVKEKFNGVEAIAGVATAGIPQGVLVADLLHLPFIYVRSKPKGHGLENLIEGNILPGQKVVVIEDLISTGGSSIQATMALKNAGIDVMGLIAIFTYQFPQADVNFTKEHITFYALSNYTTLIEVALEKNLIEQSDVKMLNAWRQEPENWGKP